MGAIPRRFHTHCQSTLNHPTFTSTIHTRDMYALCRPCANLSHISSFSLAATHMPLPRDSPPFPTILSHTSPKYTHTHTLSLSLSQPNQNKNPQATPYRKAPWWCRTRTWCINHPYNTILHHRLSRSQAPLSLSLCFSVVSKSSNNLGLDLKIRVRVALGVVMVMDAIVASAPGYASFRAQLSSRRGAYCSFLVTLSLVFFGTKGKSVLESWR